MASMSQETKEKLRQITEEKRKKVKLAKDYEVADWLVAADYAKEQGYAGEWELNQIKNSIPVWTTVPVVDPEPGEDETYTYLSDNTEAGQLAYLKYVPKQCVLALTEVLPCMELIQPIPKTRGERKVWVFWYETINCMMQFLKLDERKYLGTPWEFKIPK